LRDVPIFTYVNKLDRDLLDEIARGDRDGEGLCPPFQR
jgi:hypothetical protein